MDWEQYIIENPREIIPDKEMGGFLKYAQAKYMKFSDDCVNGTHHFDDDEDRDAEVKDYIGESMEALLLFKEYLQLNDKSRKVK